MGTVAFRESGDFMPTRFPNMSEFEDERLYSESETCSRKGFEEIVGKSSALQRVLEQVPGGCSHQRHRPAARRDGNG